MTRKMWAVGPDGDGPWYAYSAKTERGAISAYLAENGGERQYMCAMRVPAWDGLEKVLAVDWFNAGNGLTAWCSVCDAPTSADYGGVIHGGEIFCECCKEEVNA